MRERPHNSKRFRHTNEIAQTAHYERTAVALTRATSNQDDPAPLKNRSTNYTYNYYSSSETWLASFGQIAAIASALLLTLFTGGLLFVAYWQWRVANATLIFFARPKLVVRWLRLRTFEPEEVFKLEYTVINIGASTARIVESNMAVIVGILGPVPHIRPPYARGDVLKNPLIESGTWITRTYESEDVVTKDVHTTIYDRALIYFFVGYLLCADEIGNKRLTAFCRKFDPISRTFALVDSEEHESVD
jgi:hypothetical protein